VEAPSFAGQRVPVDGLLDQGVPEVVILGGGFGHEQPRRNDLSQCSIQLQVVEAGDRAKELVVDIGADHGCRAKDGARLVGEPCCTRRRRLRD
jgi:hypothetical protein